MKAMILAAGKGERMLPLTAKTPKPLLAAAGKSLIVHQLEKLAAAGFTDLVINHAWLGEQVESTLGDGSTLGVHIRWSRESEPLETAGGIIQALPLLEENAGGQPFACVNSDIWTEYNFSRLQGACRDDCLAYLVLVANPEQHPEGDFVLDAGSVREGQPGESRHTYSGIAVYHPDLFAGVPAGKQSVVPLLKQAMTAGRVRGEYFDGQWFDIGTPERLQELNDLLSA